MTVQTYNVSGPQYASIVTRILMFVFVCLVTPAAIDTFVDDGRSREAISHAASVQIHRFNNEFRYWIDNIGR